MQKTELINNFKSGGIGFDFPIHKSYTPLMSGDKLTSKIYDATGDTPVSTAFCYSGYAFSGTRFGTRIDAGNSGIGKYIKKIAIPLIKLGLPTGNFNYAVYDSTDTLKEKTGGYDASTLTGSYVSIELELDDYVKIEEGDIIAFVYESGSAGNFPTS